MSIRPCNIESFVVAAGNTLIRRANISATHIQHYNERITIGVRPLGLIEGIPSQSTFGNALPELFYGPSFIGYTGLSASADVVIPSQTTESSRIRFEFSGTLCRYCLGSIASKYTSYSIFWRFYDIIV